MQTQTQAPKGVNEQSWIVHQEILKICDRDSVDYSEAYDLYHQSQGTVTFAEQTSNFNPESVRLHKIVEAAAEQYDLSYWEAYGRVCSAYQSGKVPLLDWSKVSL